MFSYVCCEAAILVAAARSDFFVSAYGRYPRCPACVGPFPRYGRMFPLLFLYLFVSLVHTANFGDLIGMRRNQRNSIVRSFCCGAAKAALLNIGIQAGLYPPEERGGDDIEGGPDRTRADRRSKIEGDRGGSSPDARSPRSPRRRQPVESTGGRSELATDGRRFVQNH